MNILITGAGSYVGTSVERWIKNHSNHHVETLDMLKDTWRDTDFSQYDVVYHVAGIAHVNAKASMEALYYKVNRDLTIEVAQIAKKAGVKQFIFMSSMIVFHESRSLKPEMITSDTLPCPNGFYGDSKLQAEKGLHELECDTFKVCILRPPMIYGPNSKGNFPRLIKLAAKTPIFPDFHNQRSMLYIDNLAEFVLQAVNRQLSGTFYPQNRELSDTVEIIRYFAKAQHHTVYFAKWLNPFVRLASHFLQPINKMFGTYYYAPEMSKMPFDYQITSFEESLKHIV
ncbi:MAG: NAD-dependent epimerase/dehydratase family protein [Paludibacteraceae bacterium]|nr:NAD-dependent epimerase/dehydratase family protein [Paludibacteraceae bacterium]